MAVSVPSMDRHKWKIEAALWAIHKVLRPEAEICKDLRYAPNEGVRFLHDVVVETSNAYESPWHQRTIHQVGDVVLWAGMYDTAFTQPFQYAVSRVLGAADTLEPHFTAEPPEQWYANQYVRAKGTKREALFQDSRTQRELEAFVAENLRKRGGSA